MTIKCMIIDDEPLAIELLETHIAAIEELELIATCASAIEASSIIRNKEVELLFLDIQMPRLNGIEFVKTLRTKPKIVITSAHREYAYEAFQIDAVDYLLKPVTFERFLTSINKIFDKSSFNVSNQNQQEANKSRAFIYVKVKRKMMKIQLDEILYVESLGDYVKIICQSQKVVAQQKISLMEDKLPGDQFLRIHRSFIVSLQHLKTFSTTTVEIAEREIPIGRSYKEWVMKRLGGGI